MSPLPQILCKVIGHHRSRRRAYFDASDRRWCSYCRHCGTPMEKEWPRGWVKKAA